MLSWHLSSDEWVGFCSSLGFKACPCSFPSCGGKNPEPKSGQDLDPDKPECTMFCRGDETDPNFPCPFL